MSLDNFSEVEGIKVKTLKELVPVKGVPFLKETRNHKQIKQMFKDDRKVVFELENHSLDVPYADSFRVIEKWVCLTSTKGQNKCICR